MSEWVIVAAVARNGVIGRGGALPWRLKSDLRHFRRLTTGHAVLMGRKTWESLGRPLPDRRNVVVSRDPSFTAPGAEVYPSLDAARVALADEPVVFVIGGAQLYRQTLPFADRLVITEVDAEPQGDAFFPEWDRSRFLEAGRQALPAEESDEYPAVVVTYIRRPQP
ncbi:dihydrofolate reductase [Tepidiphilus margaritifer]|uniref:dihydrofolate reductase n=1 Tax=Tepidiphilus margaritifer TaxID=203471 RepID=UPI00048F77C1|nr:dihydrofolate reductase [Tepidiphilus margaritifer]